MTMTMPTMTIRTARLLIALCLIGAPVVAFNGLTGSNGAVSPARTATKLAAADNTDNAHHHYDDDDTDDDTQASFATRRAFLNVGGAALAAASLVAPAQAVERAVGGAEIECRKRGDCLQKGELDGAVGWNWGANERCDPSDPRCGSDGVLRDAPPAGDAVPSTPNAKVTHEVTLSIQVGRAESGTLRFGLFGDATPKSVQELVDFLSPGGLATSSKFLFEEGFGMVSAPLSMSKGYGLLTGIVPQKILTFGIPSQSAAYARSIGSSTAGDNFAPQPRPKEQLQNEKPVRLHDAAGLISIASAGVGYASNGPEDETFSKGECDSHRTVQ